MLPAVVVSVAKATSIGLVVVRRSVAPTAATPPSYWPATIHAQPVHTHTHMKEVLQQAKRIFLITKLRGNHRKYQYLNDNLGIQTSNSL